MRRNTSLPRAPQFPLRETKRMPHEGSSRQNSSSLLQMSRGFLPASVVTGVRSQQELCLAMLRIGGNHAPE
jgi:hypothetical protein